MAEKLGDATINMREFHAHDHDTPLLVRKTKKTRRLPTRTKPMHFISAHHHSTFSFLDGFQLPEAHVRRAAEIGMSAIALTEHGNVSSHVQLESAAKKHNIKPLFGVELYCGQLDENRSQRKNHLTVLAEDVDGYRNLLRLVTRTYAEGFYYEPTADDSMLTEFKEGLVVLSGCLGSALATSCIGGKLVAPEAASYALGKSVARRFKQNFNGSYYIEVQAFPELEQTRQLNPMLARMATELKIPLVVTFDCHYTVPTEKEIQKILHNVRDGSKQTLEEQTRNWGYDTNLCPPWNDNMILRKLVATGLTRKQAVQAILNAAEVGDRCNVELPHLPIVRYPTPHPYTDNISLWRAWLQEGWLYRGLDKLPSAERSKYRERLKMEVELIEQKDFIDYFLVVSDAIRWAKDNDIAVGPARGSAAGSLACWLLRITEVNPVPYPDLIFERFIDITRQDLPDIDLDFDSETRGQVRDYLVSKYGPACVGNVANFTGYKGKNALDDVARVFRVPKWEVEKIKDVLIERSSGDLRASATIEDTVEQFEAARGVFEEHPDLAYALDLEGNYKGMGVHAAGLVVSAGPLTEVAALYERVVKGATLQVISMDKYDAEKMGLLKLDFLGLSNMTMLNKCRQQMGWSLDELYNLPLEDERVIAGFHRNDIIGIFQFEGRAMRYVNGALKPDSFAEVMDVNALARPGPLHNGSMNEYVDIKMGRKKPELLHPALADITGNTQYQIVYQEQILRIMGEIFNFDWTHRAEVRRIISRKIGEQEFNRRWSVALEGAKILHPEMSEEIASKIWGACITAGSYAFNAAHSMAYSMLGVYTMWFKQYEPELFYAETLNISDKERAQVLLRDAVRGNGKRKSIDIVSPHPQRSGKGWRREKELGAIQAGLSQIPGVGGKTADQIIEYREENEVKSWDDFIKVKGIGPATIQKIKDYTAEDDPHGAFWLDRAIAEVKEDLRKGKLRAHDKKGNLITLPKPTHVAADLPYTKGKDIEVVWLGTIQTRNVRDMFEWNRAKTGIELKPEDVKDPHLNEWMVCVGDDESDQMGVRIDRYKYPIFRDRLWKMKPGEDLVLIHGVKPAWLPTRQITVWDLWIIEP